MRLRLVLSTLLACLITVDFAARQDCSQCKPAQVPTITHNHQLKISVHALHVGQIFESDVTAAVYYSNLLVNNDPNLGLRYVSNNNEADILIYVDEYLGASGLAEVRTDGSGGDLFIGEDALGNVPYLQRLLQHEAAHFLGFDNAPPGCGPTTSITAFPPLTGPGVGPFGALTCADDLAAKERFPSAFPIRRDEDGDGYSPDDPWGSSSWEVDGGGCDQDASRHPGVAPTYCSIPDWTPQFGQDYNCNGQDDGYDGCPESPIVIDLAGNGFHLTNASGGVLFDLNGDGVTELLSWTSPASDDSWLILDRSGNGLVDDGTEMFGNFTEQPPSATPNGFNALGMFDQNGDQWVDASDQVFTQLRVWTDSNHDGVSQSAELRTLPAAGVARLSLDYRASGRRDQHGNLFKYRAVVTSGRLYDVGRFAWDVFLTTLPHSSAVQASVAPKPRRIR